MTPRNTTSHPRLRRFLGLILTAGTALAMPLSAQTAFADAFDRPDLQRIESKIRSTAEKAMPAVVALTHASEGKMASGTGTIVSNDGLIPTAAHVVAGSEQVDVMFLDGRTVKAKVLGADAARDVALARIETPGDYPFVEMGRSGGLKVGDAVVALGHSGGFDPRRTPPVRYGRIFSVDVRGFLQSDCTLVGGDSGGPLLDLDGKLIGVHSNIGLDTAANHDAPVDVVHDNWKRLLGGERWGKPLADHGAPVAPKMDPAELAGLDVTAFQKRLYAAALEGQGKVDASPETLSRWLTECGMEAARVKAFTPAALAEFVGKVMGNSAKVEANGPGVAAKPLSDEERAGLDVEHFRARIIENGMKNGGKLELTPKAIREWLRADGMKAERVDAMSDGEVVSFIGRVMGGAARAELNARPAAATQPAGLPADLDVKKFSQLVMGEAVKGNGKLEVTPEKIAGWLKKCGMPAEKVDAMNPAEIAGLMSKALGGGAGVAVQSGQPLSAEQMKVLSNQDRAVLATIRPDLAKVAPSVVTMTDGDEHVLALGTVVREDGFILTKRSEAAKAKSALRARLADGRSFPATIVHEFADHDLALVKVDADGLPSVTFDANELDLRPGGFVFAPGAVAGSPMLAAGVISVATRSLLEAGGYLGINLTADGNAVKVGQLAPDSPAGKAGIKEGDVIVAIDGMPVSAPVELSRQVRSLKPGAVAKLTCRRGEEPAQEIPVTLGDRAKLPKNDAQGPHAAMLAVGTKVSDVSVGFPAILQHDQPINPQDCGGPIVDLNGAVAGLNIARAGRVATYAIPATVLAELLKAADLDKLTGGTKLGQ